ncbi:hypothetical protein [Paenibacillus sp. Marseille-Q4541]|uniref:hypothetical protein n=1 Tax=Paenibacillus sp. Marseille-Q4541 TaxID=2831522 RepID=UPI001BA77DCF|nr:hypothetical protein [Paenibacillus sp. Marseille-Q4541]
MQSHQMQPISSKELDYIADSLSNEDLLIKQCAATASSTQNPMLKQVLQQQIQLHQQNANMLIGALQQHQSLAPTQPSN